MKLGSLFDGSGGFPLAGILCGIEPVWAAEVEPYPIAVTRSRFPKMKHLGNVNLINGAEIEPVDIVTFGSPCQDLSVAGKRAGLKHEANGDEETTRSGLFVEAVRIIKEMREATNGEYPTFALWENVPGAFSSNNGEDFRTVLEELIKIVEPEAVMPAVPKNGWPYADSYCGDGWSLAYRVFDAQYWGVPQRRRRIHLVLDLRGERARKVLFECEGVRGYFAEGRTPWQSIATDAQNRTGADDREGVGAGAGRIINLNKHDVQSKAVLDPSGIAPALYAGECRGGGGECYVLDCARSVPYTLKISSGCEGGGNSHPDSYTGQDAFSDMLVAYPEPVAYSMKSISRSGKPLTEQANPIFASDYKDPDIVAYPEHGTQYIVRRVTPTECARLQGFPDTWGHIDHKADFTDEEYAFWTEARCTHAVINGKEPKTYSKEQMLKWYNGLHTDSAEYKMWGNGIAMPPALYVMQGMAEAKRNGGAQ